jgi:hypothetical protein
MHIKTELFGIVEIGEDAPYVKRQIEVNGRTQNCGLYIASDFTDHASQSAELVRLIDNIASFDTASRTRLMQDFQIGSTTVVDYLDFHLTELAEPVKQKLGTSTLDRELLLRGLDLRAIGLHWQDGMIKLWLDYCPGEDFSDQLLVVKLRPNADIIEISHES